MLKYIKQVCYILLAYFLGAILSPVTELSYEDDTRNWEMYHMLAITFHTLVLALEYLDKRSSALMLYIFASFYWNTSIHIMTTKLRKMSNAMNRSFFFAVMDLTHTLVSAVLVQKSIPKIPYKMIRILGRSAVLCSWHNRLWGIVGTLGTPSHNRIKHVRHVVAFFYPESIDKTNNIDYLFGIFPFTTFLREIFFQSDLCSSLVMTSVIAMSFITFPSAVAEERKFI